MKGCWRGVKGFVWVRGQSLNCGLRGGHKIQNAILELVEKLGV